MGDLPGRACHDSAAVGESISWYNPNSRAYANLLDLEQFKQRSVWVSCIFQFFFAGSYFVILYYQSIYFQSVFNTSAVGSGVRNLPLIILLSIAAIFQGMALSKIGFATPFMLVGAAIGAISCGLFYTLDVDTSTGKWIGYQILCGFAVGGTFQVSIAVIQVSAKPEDMSSATAMIFCEYPLSPSTKNGY